MMRKIFQALSLIIIFSMLISTVPPIAFATDDATEADIVLKDSIVMYSGKSFYYSFGKKSSFAFSGKAYFPVQKDDTLYIPALLLKQMLGLKLNWDTATEKITLTNDEHTVNMRVGEDAIFVDETGEFISNYAKSNKNSVLLPFSEVAQGFGYEVAKVESLWVATKNADIAKKVTALKPETLVTLNELFEEYIFSESFNNPSINMSYGYWADTNPGNGIENVNESGTNKAAYINTLQNGFAGYYTSRINRGKAFNKKDLTYKVAFSYKVTEDFTNSKIMLGMFYYNNGAFLYFASPANIVPDVKNEWQRAVLYISSEDLPNVNRNFDHDAVEIIFSAQSLNGGTPVSGKLYIDDVRISGYKATNGVMDTHMVADKYAAWYILGETVTYTPKFPESLASALNVTAKVYNIDGNLVYTNTTPASTVASRGWSYTPTENGLYDVEFYAEMADGSSIPLVATRTVSNQGGKSVIESPLIRRQFYVAKSETKKMDDRNESLYFSTSMVDPNKSYDTDFVKLANVIGFYGCRHIALDWGDRPNPLGGSIPGVESKKGTYNWNKMDDLIKTLKIANIQKPVVCIMSTPAWAAPSADKMTNTAGEKISPTAYTMTGMYIYNCYAPTDYNDWIKFIKELVTRYKDDVYIWEIWNEPMMGKTAFWYDTPENYAKLLRTAYETIKAIDPNIKVSTAGMGDVETYHDILRAMMKADPGILDCMDYYAAHGTYDAISGIKKIIEEEAGHKPIPWIDTEGYYAAFADILEPTELTASSTIISYLMQYKLGCKLLSFYDVLNFNEEKEDVIRKGGGLDWSLFRYYPYIEPKRTGAALYTLFELIGKDFEYKAEYEFDNGQKGVLCKNDDKNMLIVWNPKRKDSEILPSVMDCLKDGGELISLDGRTLKTSLIPKNQIAYLTDVDLEKLSAFASKADTALNPHYVGSPFDCKTSAQQEEQSLDNLISMSMPKEKIFDEKTFKITSEIEWVEDDYTWGSESGIGTPAGFSARHTAYMADNGFYLMVDVNDNKITTSKSPNTMWGNDNVQFSLKVNNEGTPMHEFSVGVVDGKPVVYKEIGASELSNQPPVGYTPAENVIKSAKVSIEKTGKGQLYKIFIPADELWPYFHTEDKEYIRLSICVNDNDGDGRLGWMQWGRGIASGGKNAALFGVLWYKK